MRFTEFYVFAVNRCWSKALISIPPLVGSCNESNVVQKRWSTVTNRKKVTIVIILPETMFTGKQVL